VDWSVYGQAEVVPQFIGAGIMAALALALLWLAPGRRATVAFALFLLFRAVRIVVGPMQDLAAEAGATDDALFWARVGPYFAIASLVALVAFITNYPRPYGWIGGPNGLAALIAVGFAVEALYLLDHDLYYTPGLDADGSFALLAYGPMFVAGNLVHLLGGVAAFLAVWEWSRSAPGPARSSFYLVGLAFALNAVYDAAAAITATTPGALPTAELTGYRWATQAITLTILSAAPVLFAAVILARRALGANDESRRQARSFLAVLPLPAVTVLLVVALGMLGAETVRMERLTVGVWRLAMPLLVSYALVKFQLFDIDLRMKVALRSGTVAGAFVATFFVISESAAQYFGTWAGNVWIGLAAAGLLVFALHPIARLGDRIAHRAFPGVRDTATWRQERREELYRSAVEFALMDGTITIHEHRRLGRMAERLGLSETEALRVQREVERALGWIEPALPKTPAKRPI
jgi:hypothetical protein